MLRKTSVQTGLKASERDCAGTLASLSASVAVDWRERQEGGSSPRLRCRLSGHHRSTVHHLFSPEREGAGGPCASVLRTPGVAPPRDLDLRRGPARDWQAGMWRALARARAIGRAAPVGGAWKRGLKAAEQECADSQRLRYGGSQDLFTAVVGSGAVGAGPAEARGRTAPRLTGGWDRETGLLGPECGGDPEDGWGAPRAAR